MGWSVSPGRGAVGSERGETGEEEENVEDFEQCGSGLVLLYLTLNSPWSTGVVLELELEWAAGAWPGGQGGEV